MKLIHNVSENNRNIRSQVKRTPRDMTPELVDEMFQNT